MEFFDNLANGFSVALTPINFGYCLIGATLGTLVGILPGLGPITTMAMLLPITFKMPAAASLIMLSGIYYGAHHAGSTTAIMLNMPGEPTSVVICLDGSPMARQGRAGPALSISALSSFFAGCVCVVIIALFSPVLSRVAISFGAAEYVSLILLALVAVSVVSSGAIMTTLAMTVLGLLLGTIGTDITSGYERFTFGIHNIVDGVNFVALAVGLFAFAQVIVEIGAGEKARLSAAKVKRLLPTRADIAAAWKPILRGTGLGAIIGIFPGTGPLIASFASYGLERRLAKDPTRFGQGAIEGVAGPEAANNAAAFTHFIPMLTMGIPAGAAMAIMLGALTIQGVSAGPQLMTKHPDLFWGVIASMVVGNLMLLVLNLPLIGIWIRLLTIPYRFLYPVVLALCCIGTYSFANSAEDIVLAAAIGIIGFLFIKIDCPPSPLILGFVLEAPFEENFRRALILSRGDAATFIERPISLGLLICSAILLSAFCVPKLHAQLKRRLSLQTPAADLVAATRTPAASGTQADSTLSGWTERNFEAVGSLPASEFKPAIKHAGDRWLLYTAAPGKGVVVTDVTDPKDPRTVKCLDSPPNTAEAQVSLHGDLLITGMSRLFEPDEMSGARSELISTIQPPKPADANYCEGVRLWSLKDPANPVELSRWGAGSLGIHHTSYPGGKYAFLSSWVPGFRGLILIILDVSDPKHPREAGRWWHPGQKADEVPGPVAPTMHGPAAISADGHTLVVPYTHAVVNLDISDPTKPKVIGSLT